MSDDLRDVLTPRSYAHHYGPNVMANHYVYRCYDKDGGLLYIGCTKNVERRIAAHRRGGKAASRWLAVFMDRHEVEGPFRGRDLGREVESFAIQSERPLFNIQHTASENRAASMQWGSIARYLVDRGHVELARATACECWRETREAGARDLWCVAHEDEDRPLFDDLPPSA